MTNQSRHIVLVGTGYRDEILFRIINRILEIGHTFSFIFYDRSFSSVTTKIEHIKSSSKYFREISGEYSEDELTKALSDISNLLKIDTALTLDDFAVLPLSAACESLGIKFVSKKAAALAKNKHAIQRVLHTCGLQSIKSMKLEQFMESENPDLRYPLIIKPASGAASINVCKVQNFEEVCSTIVRLKKSQYKPLPPGTDADFIVEEYVNGPLFSVECLAMGNNFKILGQSLRQRSSISEITEIGSILPAPFSLERNRQIEEFAEAVCKTIGFDFGICHIEMIWCCTENKPKLLDFNPRMPGGGIPILIERSSGVRVPETLVDCIFDIYDFSKRQQIVLYAGNMMLGAACDSFVPSQLDLSLIDAIGVKIRLDTGRVEKCYSNFQYFGEIHYEGKTPDEVLEKLDKACELLEKILQFPLSRWAPFDRTLSVENCELHVKEHTRLACG